MLSTEQITFYHNHGYLHIEKVFTPGPIADLRKDLDWMISVWANIGVGWTGPWRQALMDLDTEVKSKLIAMHDLQFYADSWMRAVTSPDLTGAVARLLAHDPDSGGRSPVELHHSTMHVKPPETGHPFPMHQDWPYFPTLNDSMIAGIIHVSEATDEMGCLRVCPGSHKLGRMADANGRGEALTDYPIERATVVECAPGDVIFFHYFTLHGSMPNRSGKVRKTVLCQLYAGTDSIEPGNTHPDERLVLRGWNHRLGRAAAGEAAR